MAIDITKKTWRNLAQLKNHIELNVRGENVLSFDGAFLETNKHVYGLVDGQLTVDNEVQEKGEKKFKKGKTVSKATKNRLKLLKKKVAKKKAPAKRRVRKTSVKRK